MLSRTCRRCGNGTPIFVCTCSCCLCRPSGCADRQQRIVGSLDLANATHPGSAHVHAARTAPAQHATCTGSDPPHTTMSTRSLAASFMSSSLLSGHRARGIEHQRDFEVRSRCRQRRWTDGGMRLGADFFSSGSVSMPTTPRNGVLISKPSRWPEQRTVSIDRKPRCRDADRSDFILL